MKASVFLMFTGILSGIWAAWLWYRSAITNPYVDPADETGATELNEHKRTNQILNAFVETASLNKKAALWTAGSVALNAMASVAQFALAN